MAERKRESARPGERTTPAVDLTTELDGLSPSGKFGGPVLKVDALFGDRPDVLLSIKRARARRVSFQDIADALSREGTYLSPSSVERWLKTNKLTEEPVTE